MTVTVLLGSCLTLLATLPDQSVQCCVTSPPYHLLRTYLPSDHPDKHLELGAEATVDEYVENLVTAFREVRRVLRDDGTLWINLGDRHLPGKQLAGLPWRVAFALQADGWILRSEIIWHKVNSLPESVRDRPTKGHETVFLLSKREKYHYDRDAILEDAKWERWGDQTVVKEQQGAAKWIGNRPKSELQALGKKNRRSVWSIPTRPFKGIHPAAFPPALVEPCILAGCPKGGIVLDPFAGAFTTSLVCERLGRDSIAIELNPEYVKLGRRRIEADGGLLAKIMAA